MADNELNVYRTFICLLSNLRTVGLGVSTDDAGALRGRQMTAYRHRGTIVRPASGGAIGMTAAGPDGSRLHPRTGARPTSRAAAARARHRSPHACPAGPRSCMALTTSGREGPL